MAYNKLNIHELDHSGINISFPTCRIGVNWHVPRIVMADYPILIFDDLVYEDFAERDNTEDPTDHYSVSPLEEATEHQVA